MSAFTVYDITDADGTVVYVGATVDPTARLRNLRACAPWWQASYDMRPHAVMFDREEARRVEARRIAHLRPPHNAQHAGRHTATYAGRASGNLIIGTPETAALLGWSLAKVKREAKAGRLPSEHKLPGSTGAYLFDRSVIETIAANRARVEQGAA